MFAILLLCCACTWWFARQWRLQRLTANIPTLSGALPLIGHTHKFVRNRERLWEYIQDIQTEVTNGGGVMKLWLGPMLFFFITDLKFAQKMLRTFEDKVYIYDFAQSWLRDGLFIGDVSIWRPHRKLLNPTFNPHIVDGYLKAFNEISAAFVTNIQNEAGNEEFDIFPYIKTTSLRNICQTALGLSTSDTLLNCNNEYIDAARKMFDLMVIRFQNIWMHPSFLYKWTNTKREEEKVVKILKKMPSDIIESRKSARILRTIGETQGRPMKGFLDHLLELQSEGLLTNKEINDEVNTMIIAGSESTARTIMFILIMLSSHSDVQDRVYNELKEAESSCDDVNKNLLLKLVYMEAVIKETQRLYTVVPLVARTVTQDSKQDNFVLPSGSGIVVALSGIHRTDYWGPDVDDFRPERWLDGSLSEDTSAFVAFSMGRRNCLGQNFAMMLMKTVLVHFLRRYRVSRNEAKLRVIWDSMLKPEEGYNVIIKLRQ